MAPMASSRLKGGVPKADFASLYFFVVKSSVGVGCLALPTVFHSAGWLLGAAMSCLICGAVTFGIFALLRTKHYLERRGRTVTTYQDIGEGLAGKRGKCFVEVRARARARARARLAPDPQNVPRNARSARALRRTRAAARGPRPRAAPGPRSALEVTIVSMQLGVCSVYFTFLATVLDRVLPVHGGLFSTVGYKLLLAIPLICTCWIRYLKHLGEVAKGASACYLFAVLGVLVFAVARLLARGSDASQHSRQLPLAVSKELPSLFATLVYSFEGLSCSVMQVENSMAQPSRMRELIYSAMGTTCVRSFTRRSARG